MLQGYIEIFYKLFFPRHRFKQFIGYSVGVSVKGSYPVQTFYFAKLAQKFCQHWLAVNILAVGGSVLCHHCKLLYPARSQFFSLFNAVLNSAASHSAPYFRYRAVGAAVIAPIAYFKICAERIAAQNSVTVQVELVFICKNIFLASVQCVGHYFGYIAVRAYAYANIDLWYFLGNVVFIALCKAAGYDKRLALTCLFILRSL